MPGNPAPDVMGRTYSNVSTYSDTAPAGGTPGTVTVGSGFSFPTILTAFGIPSSSFTVAEIVGPDGHSVLLTNAQAESETAFPDGPAVVWQDSAGVYFLLPSSGSGTTDDGETFAGQSDELDINLYSGALLSVSITSSTQTVKAGKPVHFSATATGALPGETLSYKWYFDDGNGGSQASINHSYLVAGTYDVYLRVTGSKDSIGYSSMIPITVGKAPKGPDRNGGGETKKKKAPASGAGSKGAGDKKSAAKKATTKTTTTAAATTTTATTTSATTTPTTPAASHHSPASRAPRPAGPLLSGIALSAAQITAAQATPTASARPGVPNPARTGHLTPHGRGIGEGFWVALGTLGTLLSGALLEAYGPPRRSWLPHLPELRGVIPGLR
jgi:hypothetical protein